MPAEVYLVPDVNAWVMQRGGLMDFGSRRVMGLGLPLMRILTCSQLRAMLAHEFGHYHGGDTKIGPWIYKTRGAIVRTVNSLGSGSWLQKPFFCASDCTKQCAELGIAGMDFGEVGEY
jgi:Zn-dependent protease with chaperone function